MRPSRLVVAAAVLAISTVASGQSTTLQGTWVLDLKASKDVPESQKGLDLKVAIKGNQLTMVRMTGAGPVGTPLTFMLDGSARQMEVGPGQAAQVEAKWITRGTKLEQVIKMIPAGSMLPIVQKTVMELAADGVTMRRIQETTQAGETTDRLMVYKRKE